MTPEEKNALDQALTDPPSDYQEPAEPPAPACHVERFRQPEGTLLKKVDLLFVTDTSGSMDYERQSIADGIGSFVGELPADADYRVAVMLGHGSRSNYYASLYAKGRRGPVLDSTKLALPDLRANLKSLLTGQPDDYYSDGGEELLFSFQQALLEPNRLTRARDQGFFRPDAALAVIFVSDENDICARYPAGVTRVPDIDGNLERKAFERDCGSVTPESVLAAVQQLQGDRPFLLGGIVYNNQNYPRGNENEYGYGFMELIQQSKGISVDLAGGHYDTGLADIGKLVTRQITLRHDFDLAIDRAKLDPATIDVHVDGDPVAHEYVAEKNRVHVDQAGEALSSVDVGYCEKAAESPEPTPTPTPTQTAPVPSPSPAPSPTPSGTPSPQPSPEPSPSPTSCSEFGCGGGVA
jgi:hypothetical protein